MWKSSEPLLGAGRTMIPSQDLKERLVGVVSEQIPPDPGHDPNCPGGSVSSRRKRLKIFLGGGVYVSSRRKRLKPFLGGGGAVVPRVPLSRTLCSG